MPWRVTSAKEIPHGFESMVFRTHRFGVFHHADSGFCPNDGNDAVSDAAEAELFKHAILDWNVVVQYEELPSTGSLCFDIDV